MKIVFVRDAHMSHPAKIADAELHFDSGPLAGLRLIGFAVWKRDGRLSVTLPSRQFEVRGERRSFSQLRNINESGADKRLRELILEAYNEAEHEGRRQRE